MREIKFRAWNSNTNSMVNDIFKDPSCPAEHFLDKKYGFIPMQFTGLHDKNGKEIYEGDILRRLNGRIDVVEFESGCFVVRHPNGDCDFIAQVNNYEVIGNIYENPELLEAK